MPEGSFPLLFAGGELHPPASAEGQALVVAGPTLADQARAIGLVLSACEARRPLAIAAEDAEPPDAAEPRGSGLTFFTSGTTGAPKAIVRGWEELVADVSAAGDPRQRFLLTYNVARFAGLQVLFHCRRHSSPLILPASLRDARGVIEAGATQGATHLSVTPTFLRRLVMAGAAKKLTGLRQITLGGENATQPLLDTVRRLWPAARITSIYASSEAGACFAVSDGREGIPLEALACGRGGRSGKLAEDGELLVTLQDGRLVRTGDFFEVVDGRALFRGRREDLVNVGGYKVSPVRVERVLLGVDGVEECRVYGRRSPVVGEVVVAELAGSYDLAAVKEACRDQLERAEIPSLYRQVESLGVSPAQKLVRAARRR